MMCSVSAGSKTSECSVSNRLCFLKVTSSPIRALSMTSRVITPWVKLTAPNSSLTCSGNSRAVILSAELFMDTGNIISNSFQIISCWSAFLITQTVNKPSRRITSMLSISGMFRSSTSRARFSIAVTSAKQLFPLSKQIGGGGERQTFF